MTAEEFIAEFGVNGWKQLPDVIAKRYQFCLLKLRWMSITSAYTPAKQMGT